MTWQSYIVVGGQLEAYNQREPIISRLRCLSAAETARTERLMIRARAAVPPVTDADRSVRVQSESSGGEHS